MKTTTIYALIGSWAGQNSHTGQLCDKLAEELIRQTGSSCQYIKKTADQWNIGFCRSCGQCFRTGFCPQTPIDGMQQICQEIQNADFLIIGTPVYAASLSGSTKNLVDRLSLWLHTMPLIGKVCAIITTTSTNHAEDCIPYLTEIFGLMGASVAAHGSAYVTSGHPLLTSADEIHDLAVSMASSMLEAVGNPAYFTATQQLYFLKQNRRYRAIKELSGLFPAVGELRCWERQGYFECEDLAGALKRSI